MESPITTVTRTPSVVSTGNFNIGRYRIGGIVQITEFRSIRGYISEVLIYSNALTSVQRAQVQPSVAEVGDHSNVHRPDAMLFLECV